MTGRQRERTKTPVINPITVVGAGPGSADLLTKAGMDAVGQAELVWCAGRLSHLAPREKRRPLIPFAGAIEEMRQALKNGQRGAVLLSGDTGLYSLLSMLREQLGPEAIAVIPGISSVQALCARLGGAWQGAAILSAHGRALSPSALCHSARTHERALILLDEIHNPKWVHETLRSGGLGSLSLIIGERLSLPGETVAPYEDRPYDPLSVALIENGAPERGLPPIGLDDGAFLRGKTPMTRREIRVQAVCGLRLPPDAVVWDVGAGTGSVSIECARQCPLGRVYAIERNGEALSLIEKNKARFHALNLEIVAGSAPEALGPLPAPTHVFLGGTGGRAREILRLLETLPGKIRLAAAAVTMESAALYTECLARRSDFSAVQIACARLEAAGGYRLFCAQNPVFLFSATLEGNA